jgi:hypothetical protein
MGRPLWGQMGILQGECLSLRNTDLAKGGRGKGAIRDVCSQLKPCLASLGQGWLDSHAGELLCKS